MAIPELDNNLRREYPSNSMRKPEEKKERRTVKKVVSSPVTVRSESISSKIIRSIIGDTTKDVGEYLIFDVLIPTIKNAVDDMICGGTKMFLWGDTRGGRKRNGERVYTSYDRISEGRIRRGDKTRSDELKNVRFTTRIDAEEVRSELIGQIEEYGSASVRDYYEAVGESSTHLDDKYGWTDLGSAVVRGERDGYILVLPRPKPLD